MVLDLKVHVVRETPLSWFTVCWLGCQLAGFVAAPVVLGATSTIGANDLPATVLWRGAGSDLPDAQGPAPERDETSCRCAMPARLRMPRSH